MLFVQYSCGNNIVLSGIPDPVSDDTLEESVISVLADINVYMECQGIEVCYRFGKADIQKSKQTIVRFVNRKKCKYYTILPTVQKYLPVSI